MTEKEVEKLKLMVVDDEPDNLDLLYRTFWRDFKVYQAINAHDALAILDQVGEMAVIISDQRMPDMNGTEFFSRTVERFPDTIRILLTGFTDVEDLVDAINSGQVFKYITKPWKPEQLKALVEQGRDTYTLVKKRTRELRHALKRESLFNAVTTAIRESLDYDSSLQKIVVTIGQTFAATSCVLRLVEGDRLTQNQFSYHAPHSLEITPPLDSISLITEVLHTQKYQLAQDTYDQNPYHYLVVPFSYQQHLLAVMTLYQGGSEQLWQDEDIQLITGVAEQAALALSQAKLYQSLQEKQQQIRVELQLARQIQNNLLRQTLPKIDGVKIQACCYPAREVGGDFFEVFVHPQGDLWLAVGDVSGKGVPAALFMASAISLLRRELSQESPAEPNIVMQNLNYALADDLISNNYFITLVIANYNRTTQELVYANAGHIYPFWWSKPVTLATQPHYLTIRSVPLGILPQWQAQSGRLILSPGDTLLLASDGITEAKVSINSKYSEKNDSSTMPNNFFMLKQEGIWRLIQEQLQPLSLENLLTRIQTDNHVQDDDQTLLSLEVL
ncbi:SpoIIE family protein phosphatase [Sphaerospermopsis sp. LEGE 08334]|jgi:serine phosphatase RsbU (regulator of sigma subunit)/FixJ family two-component response regulator|uniref:SpoIIE family protein phosphatase n=1 Tax=Sphaerospermopsis sp. LEGE 08334 TaxID=1828651 RepID=UPI0018819241|nr:SpoIIE family protein phosphatase [Sphaerospermopsis sp. LEGE 08334]MBE9057800.1 SpoIIE family protein phosphatase [Sphaerospermopsis sp. LEGE 08334]